VWTDSARPLLETSIRGTRPSPEQAAATFRWLATPGGYTCVSLLPLFVHACGGARAAAALAPDPFARVADTYRRLLAVDVCQRRWLEGFVRSVLPAGTPLVLLKSAAFQGTLYPEGAFRAAADVDLLVREQDFSATVDLLASQGRHVVHNLKRPHSHRTYFEACFDIPGPVPVQVEIHRALTQPRLFSIDHDALVAASLPHPAYGRDNVRMLDARSALLHLAVHAVRHAAVVPHALVDTALLLARFQVDPAALAQDARRWSATTALHALLDHLNKALPGAVPSAVLRSLDPGWPRRMAGRGLLSSQGLLAASGPPSMLRKALALTLSDAWLGPAHVAADYVARRARDLVESQDRDS